jgi:hypothetical protein
VGHRGRQNCQHYDLNRRCRIHLLPWWLRWLPIPGGRETCILDRVPLMDASELSCPDQKPWPRPDPPRSQSGVRAPPDSLSAKAPAKAFRFVRGPADGKMIAISDDIQTIIIPHFGPKGLDYPLYRRAEDHFTLVK